MSPFLKSKTILVTGGSRGIGRTIAQRLAAEGAGTIIVNYLQNDTEAEKTCQLIAEHDCEAVPVKANLADPDRIDGLFEEIARRAGTLHGFVHSAAITALKPTAEIRPNQWDLTLNVNARAFLLCAQRSGKYREKSFCRY